MASLKQVDFMELLFGIYIAFKYLDMNALIQKKDGSLLSYEHCTEQTE
jgi:hypothetical protein